MPDIPSPPRRRSLRYAGYDYGQPGAYFVTACVQRRISLFGDIAGTEMRLNGAGRMVACWWNRLPEKFRFVAVDEFVVMPNHIHGIVMNQATATPEGPAALGQIVAWFKTMTTNAYIRGVTDDGWRSFDGRLWQRNYYEHIIRSEDDLNHIREYIAMNPAKWAADRENVAASEIPMSDYPWQV